MNTTILSRSTKGSRLVPLNELRVKAGPFENPRPHDGSGLDQPKVHELAESIKRSGVITPLVIEQVRVEGIEDLVELVNHGQRRWHALHLLASWGDIPKDAPIWVVDRIDADEIRDLDQNVAAQAMGEALEADLLQVRLSSYELVHAAVDLKTRDMPQAEISLRVGRSESWVSKMLSAWAKATDELREAFRTGKVTDEQFKDLALVKKVEQVEALATTVELRERGERSLARDVAKAKAAEVAPPPRERTKPPKSAPAPAARKESLGMGGGRLVPAEPSQHQKDEDDKAWARTAQHRAKDVLALHKISPALDTYSKGAVDMARYLAGEGNRLGKPYKTWLKRAEKMMQAKAKKLEAKAVKPVKTSKPAKAKRATSTPQTTLPVPPKKGAPGSAKSKRCLARHHAACKDTGCGCECHA